MDNVKVFNWVGSVVLIVWVRHSRQNSNYVHVEGRIFGFKPWVNSSQHVDNDFFPTIFIEWKVSLMHAMDPDK